MLIQFIHKTNPYLFMCESLKLWCCMVRKQPADLGVGVVDAPNSILSFVLSHSQSWFV